MIRTRSRVRALLANFCLAVATLPATAGAAEPVPSVKEIREQIDAAGKRLDDGDKPGAVESLTAAVEALRGLSKGPKPPVALRSLVDRAEGMRRRLERAGVDVSSLAVPGRAGMAADAGRPAVSFSREIAPLLTKSCGGCHVSGRKGDFQMASYDALMKSGMVQRGAGRDSRLVEVITTGDMPRGGGNVSQGDLTRLVAWIDGGAAFDGPDPSVNLDVVARGAAAPKPAGPAPEVRAVSLEAGEASFAVDVVPLLAANCLRCHGGDETENGLSMATLQALLRGGRTAPAVVPGKSGESLLVKKIRGVDIEGQRMPIGRRPLSDAEVATIRRWIDEGARLDMLSAATPLATLAAAGRARSLSDAELGAVRDKAAFKLWSRAIPDETPAVERREGVTLISNLPAERLAALADAAGQFEPKVRAEVAKGEAGVLKGGVVVYVFRQSVDYSAFWQTILRAERPRGIGGHSGLLGDVAYGAMLVPGGGDDDDARLVLAEQIAAGALAGRSVPPWFAAGAGRAVAMRVVPKAPLAAEWRREIPGAIAKLGSTADFFAGHSDPAATVQAAGGFISAIAPPGKLPQLVAALDSGAAFDDAFARVFKATSAQTFERWAAKAAK